MEICSCGRDNRARTTPCFWIDYPCEQLLTSVYWLHVTQLRARPQELDKHTLKSIITTITTNEIVQRITFCTIVETHRVSENSFDLFKWFLRGKYLHLPFKSSPSPKFVNDLNYFENGQFENQNFGGLVTSECARTLRTTTVKEPRKKTTQNKKKLICFFLGHDHGWYSNES